MSHTWNGPYEHYIKRPLDMALSLLAIITLSPLFCFVCLLVRFKLGKPIIFTQERPGKDEELFKLYKFRTMTDERDELGNLLDDEERLTNFGRFLRSTSLDELPELYNILKGDMAIVGPRPLLVRYLPFYRQSERVRHEVRPGLTGPSQVSGRNLLSWDDRFALDVKYAATITFFGDCKIILKTFSSVLLRKDIVVGNDHIMKNLDDERRHLG